ncbi:phosphotransferase family protein [Erythrobacter sp. W53]|uniref:phosphotransferase family protein n=1 Tax=Erythrobacter sp. W53 TaxID=3425947 RepID=UPI003D7686D1
MGQDFELRACALVAALGLGEEDEVLSVTPLTGGVSSEIALVQLPDRQICVKFALGKLKVAAEWYAPVRRNLAEYRWLEYAAAINPDSVPQLFGHSDELGGFAMEFVAGGEVQNWKSQLLKLPPKMAEVLATARLLGEIHARSVHDETIGSRFENMEDFEALRIEPYLLSMNAMHPDIADAINVMAATLRSSRTALIHGDVSPKNVLMRGSNPILLDAECATMADPVFDVAFCLNHFLLKAIHTPRNAAAFSEAAFGFLAEYRRFIFWERPEAFEERLAKLLPMLFLARVDGKSPVEYLDEHKQAQVRQIARAAILKPAQDILQLVHSVKRELV